MGLASLLRKEGLGHGTLIQLHQLVTTELSIEQYPHIQLVVKALEKLSENEKSLQALLLSGLTSKILWWYESVFEKLTCDLGLNPALKSLTEAFFDYFLELAKPSVPVSELRVILMYLCRTALDPTVTFRLRLEAIRTFNSSLESCGPEQRKVLQGHHDIACILNAGDPDSWLPKYYELQASITETLCRLTLKLDRPIKASEWFTSDLGHAFQAIRNPYFEALSRPKDEDMEEFWVDFNLGSECVSFFVDDPNKKMFLWESIHVMRDEVNRYSLTGYLSEHTVNPSTESMTSRAEQKEDAELMGERLALDAGDMFTDELGPSAERPESNKESSGEEEVAEVKLNVEEAEVIAKQAAVAETGILGAFPLPPPSSSSSSSSSPRRHVIVDPRTPKCCSRA
uniref:Uncharacterized protein n=1 Tax=Knipowitschia caucasica TaxID=637954 RepID=A0AAV2LLJ6_KNICA